MKGKLMKVTLAALLPIMAMILYACAHTKSMARAHPTEVTAPPVCSQCHTDWRGSMDHTVDFDKRHGFTAAQNKQACALCHTEAFCSDCHANKEEIKPSDKFKDAPGRMMPHRGDYLNQHKIDGRIDPASCLKCHGRQNNARCQVCHK